MAESDNSLKGVVDKAQVLTPKQVKAYTESRKSRGDLEYNNGLISVRFPYAVDRLVAPKPEGLAVIDEHQRYSAVELIILREIALQKLDIASMREFSHWYDWCEGPRHPETLYARVMRTLETRGPEGARRLYCALIERLCFQPVRLADYGWIDRQSHHIQTAFNILGEIMAEQKARIRKENEDEADKSFSQICDERYQTYRAKTALDKATVKISLESVSKA